MVRSSGSRRTLAAVVTSMLLALVWSGAPATAEYDTIDGQAMHTGPIIGGTSSVLQVTGRGGVPASDVGAVALNVTVTNPTADSYLTVYPAGAARPNAANLVFTAGQTVPNMVIVKVGDGGRVALFDYAGTTDVVVDVLGWFPTGAAFTGLTPARLLDTRPGYATIDGAALGEGPLGAGAARTLTVAGRGGVPADGVGAVALNVTVTNPTASSFLTVWPRGAAQPTAANLNWVAGRSVPNMVVAKVGDGGQISMFNYAGSADVVVDVLGWFPRGAAFTGLTPARLMDTRGGHPTIDAVAQGTGPVGAGAEAVLTVAGRGGVPSSGVGAVALNVTATNPTAASFITAFPTGAPRPTAANLNVVAGQTVPNMVIVKVGDGGRISLFNYAGTTDLVVDVLGWFPATGSFVGLTPARLMDSRVPAPLAAAAIGPVRSHLVVRPRLQQLSGRDRVAVWVCDVPPDSTAPEYQGTGRLPVDGPTIAAWATANVSPYYQQVSRGRYQVAFEPLGRIVLAPHEDSRDCLERAVDATASPYTNVLATDTSTLGNGFGGAGLLYSSDQRNIDVLRTPPSVSRRGVWVGGESVHTGRGGFASAGVVIHELGHSVHWPHSYSGSRITEYDNPMDVMSDITINRCVSAGYSWPCEGQHTLAFNRFAAGWVDDPQVVVHTAGTSTVTLDAPLGGGTQLVAAPDAADSRVMLTIEARPAIGYDEDLGREGVALHLVDQRTEACWEGVWLGACVGSTRRQQQLPHDPADIYAHVVPVGGTRSVGGVTVTVTGRVGNAFTVDVTGTFVASPPTGA